MNHEHIHRFEEAFRSPNPAEELYRLAVSLRDEGTPQIVLYELFSHFQVATSGDDPRYDAIVDTMDLIYGGRGQRVTDYSRRSFLKTKSMSTGKKPNQAAAVDAPIAFLLHAMHYWRRITAQRRYV